MVIQAHQSALFPRPGVALIAMAGTEAPGRLLELVQWTGQGSLMAPQASVAGWIRPDGHNTAVDDTRLTISGVVRSEVEFAGPVGSGVEASRINGWQAPLHRLIRRG